MKRLILFVAVALASGVVATVLAGCSGSSGRTIRLVERGGTSVDIDNPPKGNRTSHLISPGDFSAGTVKLFDRTGRAAGTLQLAASPPSAAVT